MCVFISWVGSKLLCDDVGCLPTRYRCRVLIFIFGPRGINVTFSYILLSLYTPCKNSYE